jgi:hypothetical protein
MTVVLLLRHTQSRRWTGLPGAAPIIDKIGIQRNKYKRWQLSLLQ